MNTQVKQIGGNHYAAEYQLWDFWCDTGISAMLGTPIKYLLRYHNKNGLEDLLKAKSYIEKLKDYKHPTKLYDHLETVHLNGLVNKLLTPYIHIKEIDRLIFIVIERLIYFGKNNREYQIEKLLPFLDIVINDYGKEDING